MVERDRPAQREIVGGDRDQHPLGSKDPGERQHAQHRAAVDEHRARAVPAGLQAVLELVEDVWPLAEQAVDLDQLGVRRKELAAEADRPHHLLEGLARVVVSEQALGARRDGVQDRAQMRLRVEVDEQWNEAAPRHGGAQVEDGRGLAHSALLVENREPRSHDEFVMLSYWLSSEIRLSHRRHNDFLEATAPFKRRSVARALRQPTTPSAGIERSAPRPTKLRARSETFWRRVSPPRRKLNG